MEGGAGNIEKKWEGGEHGEQLQYGGGDKMVGESTVWGWSHTQLIYRGESLSEGKTICYPSHWQYVLQLVASGWFFGWLCPGIFFPNPQAWNLVPPKPSPYLLSPVFMFMSLLFFIPGLSLFLPYNGHWFPSHKLIIQLKWVECALLLLLSRRFLVLYFSFVPFGSQDVSSHLSLFSDQGLTGRDGD